MKKFVFPGIVSLLALSCVVVLVLVAFVGNKNTQGASNGILVESDDLQGLYTKIYIEKDKIQESLNASKNKLSSEEKILRRCQEIMSKNKPGSIVIIAGAKFSYEQVAEDALKEIVTCRDLQVKIARDERLLSKLQQVFSESAPDAIASYFQSTVSAPSSAPAADN